VQRATASNGNKPKRLRIPYTGISKLKKVASVSAVRRFGRCFTVHCVQRNFLKIVTSGSLSVYFNASKVALKLEGFFDRNGTLRAVVRSCPPCCSGSCSGRQRHCGNGVVAEAPDHCRGLTDADFVEFLALAWSCRQSDAHFMHKQSTGIARHLVNSGCEHGKSLRPICSAQSSGTSRWCDILRLSSFCAYHCIHPLH
jgi:hypothetical protein